MAQSTSHTLPTKLSAWSGWAMFAGIMLLAAGGVQAIAGLTGIFHSSFYLAGANGLIAFNYVVWGWINLLLGIGLIGVGIGVCAGQMWSRLIAIFLALLTLLASVAFIAAYPIWSIIVIILNGLVIYALVMHGDELIVE